MPSLPSMPSLPTMPSMPSIDFLTSHPFLQNPKTKRRYFSSSSKSKNSAISTSNPCTPPESDLDSDHDSSPPSTPPLVPQSAKTSRSPSSSQPEPTTSSSTKDPLANLHGNVLMMGGFRGSVLRDPVANMRIWIPLKVPTGIRKVTLALGLTEEDEERSREKIVGSKMLTHVGPLDLGRSLK